MSDVEAAERVDRLVDQTLGAVPVRDVVAVGDRLAALADDLVDDVVGRAGRPAAAVHLAAEVVHHDLGALLGQHQRSARGRCPVRRRSRCRPVLRRCQPLPLPSPARRPCVVSDCASGGPGRGGATSWQTSATGHAPGGPGALKRVRACQGGRHGAPAARRPCSAVGIPCRWSSCCIVGAWAIDTGGASGQVPRNVRLAGRDVGQMSEAELAATVRDIGEQYAATEVEVATATAVLQGRRPASSG